MRTSLHNLEIIEEAILNSSKEHQVLIEAKSILEPKLQEDIMLQLVTYETPKYHYSWKKNNSTGFFTAKKQPLRCMEEIFIYYKQTGTYEPQMVGNQVHKRRNLIHTGGSGYFTSSSGAKMPTHNHETEKGSHKGRYPTTFKEWSIRKL